MIRTIKVQTDTNSYVVITSGSFRSAIYKLAGTVSRLNKEGLPEFKAQILRNGKVDAEYNGNDELYKAVIAEPIG